MIQVKNNQVVREVALITYRGNRKRNVLSKIIGIKRMAPAGGKLILILFKAIKRIMDEFNDVKVVYPVHLNPKVRDVANEVLGDCDRIKLIDPLEVIDFHNFIAKSYLILTDSGGIQEEAPSLGKPVLVLRDTTERPEGIDAGTLKLAGTDEENIYKLTKELLEDKKEYEKMSKASNPYGDGKASKRIADAIIERYGK